MPTKKCRACGEEKSLRGDFHMARRNKDGRFGTCKACRTKQAAAAYKAAPEKWAERQRAADPEKRKAQRLAKHYNLSFEDYKRLVEAQGNLCAVCRRPPKKAALNIDHNHKTGLVRGLLCWHCNHRLIGSSGDDPARLRAAAEYLERPPAVRILGKEVIAPTKRRRRHSR